MIFLFAAIFLIVGGYGFYIHGFRMLSLRKPGTVLLLLFTGFSPVLEGQSYDWPMLRYDVGRTASTPEQLAKILHLQWQVNYGTRTPVWDDPLNQNLMQFDRIFEPVVAGNTLYIGFNDRDKVIALNLDTGEERWRYYVDGPVRLPLVAKGNRLWFTSDDGFCYCLDSRDGSLVWKRQLAPFGNKLLGNKRLISMWPARGGIVFHDGVIYTAAGIFPLMGTFIYALDPATGEVIWKNEGTGSNYILQPHKSPAFAYVAPQGPFTVSGDRLLVAGGRSVPAAFNLHTGEELYYQLAASGKTGGAFTCASDKLFFNHHRGRITSMYDSETGDRILSGVGEYPVVEGDTFYFSGKEITAMQLNPWHKLDTLWQLGLPATNDLIKAGNCLYAADSSGIRAVSLHPGEKPEQVWSFHTEKIVERLLAARGKLIAVTSDGTLMVFGDMARTIKENDPPVPLPLKKSKPRIGKMIRCVGVTEGYCVVMGGDNHDLLSGLLEETSLNLVIVERDARRIRQLREKYDRAGIPNERAHFLPYDGRFSSFPPYFASLIVVTDTSYTGVGDRELLKKLFESARPYDGTILLCAKGKQQQMLVKSFRDLQLAGVDTCTGNGFYRISRNGPLEGAASWTHNYGDIANTVKSDDQLVKAPLGVLWFGGNSNIDVFPRHGHGPGEQVIDGRLIIQGINSISARDVFTGRILWKREFEKLMDDSWLVFYDETYDEEEPLNPKYNQGHLPGSNARGTNFVATKEYVYLIEGNRCNLINIRTGEIARVFETGDDSTKKLGYIGVYENLLILGNNFAEFTGLESDPIRLKSPKFTNYDLSASRELMVMDRFSGKLLWRMKAHHGFLHNSVIAGDSILFCLDKLPQYLETKLRRRGEPPPEGSRLLYIRAATGEILHEETNDVFGTWLGYSEKYKLLLQATRPSRDMLNGEEGKRMIAYNAVTRAKIWDSKIRYGNPPIIHNDKIYTNGEGFRLLTGEPLMEVDPVTGEELKWSFKREYGCGIVSASEHLLTFRTASAGFINLESFEGTGNLGGWRPGCSTNLIAADGVLNSPDYTRTCHCPYQNQTSLALIHMPWMAYWTNSNYVWNGKPIMKLGLNFNAPGDRSSPDNVLWFEYPHVSGIPPGIGIKIDTAGFRKIRKEPFSVISEKTPWVSASGLEGIRNLEITLSEMPLPEEEEYTVKLYFAELDNRRPGERVFSISLQGKEVIRHFDIAGQAGKSDREVVLTFRGIKAEKTLKLEMTPTQGNTLISGMELIRE